MTIPLVLGYLCLVWVGAVVLGDILGGTATGFVVRRAGARLEAAGRALVAAETRDLARRAHRRAAQVSAAVALLAAAVLRLAVPRDGLDAVSLGVPIGLGGLLAVPLSVWWIRTDLAAFFRSSGHTTQAGSRPPAAAAGR
jgi:hypothetical protein